MYAVILAGGGGTRLRPLSRDAWPKPFLPLVDGRTLIRHTVDRLPARITGRYVVATAAYADLLRDQVPDVEPIFEPEGRNTAAAIALATLAIDRPDDEVMAVLPADHVIVDEPLFADVLWKVGQHIATGAFGVDRPLVTLGVQVDRPATEYGYLIPDVEGGTMIAGLQAYPLKAFEEKPTRERALALRSQVGVAWNAGMFLWQRRAIRDALERHTDLVATLAPAMGDPMALGRVYAGLASRSIDVTVMEPAAQLGDVLMASMDVGWSDVGGWTALLAAIGATGTGRVVAAGEPVSLGADDLLVRRDAGRLRLVDGPSGTIRSDAPTALLSNAAGHRDRVEGLLARVATREAQEA